MPVYVYLCPACGKRQEAFRRIAERDKSPDCMACHRTTERRIVATMISVFQPYRAIGVDKESGERPLIRSKAEHEAFLRRNGYEEVGNDKSMAPPSDAELSARRAERMKEAEEAINQPTYEFDETTHHAQL